MSMKRWGFYPLILEGGKSIPPPPLMEILGKGQTKVSIGSALWKTSNSKDA